MIRLLIFFISATCIIGCTANPQEDTAVTTDTKLPGQMIFTKNCKLCHGADGTLGVSGAANLAISSLTVEEKIQVITNGRRGMASWKSILTPEEIRQVAEYTEQLKK